jgi:uncharacterized NAD(P)/FAD-binding protein YdhS
MQFTKSTDLLDYVSGDWVRIAIVGAGAAGVMVAVRTIELARRRGLRLELLLIDPAASTGRGVAYSTREHRHLLNVPAGKMSADADDPGDFTRWLDKEWQPGASASDFAPRERFGAYLASYLDNAVHDGVRVRRVQDTVTRVRPYRHGMSLELSTQTIRANAAVLAIGAFAPGCDWAPTELRNSSRFVADPWAPGALDVVPPDQDVLMVGTGLTMIDMAMLLDRPHRVLHAVSRHGLLPRSHSSSPQPPIPFPEHTGDLRETVVQHIKTCLRERRDWRPAIDGLRPRTAELWQGLSCEQRKKLLAEDGPYWEVRRHRMAPSVTAAVTRMRRAGRLRARKGEVSGVTETADGLDVRLVDGRCIRVGAVINCTGAQVKSGDPLVEGLLQDGFARRGPVGLGLDTANDGWLLPADGHAGLPVWAIGAQRKGNLWETMAFPEIRQSAGELAEALLGTIRTHVLMSAGRREEAANRLEARLNRRASQLDSRLLRASRGDTA